MAHGDDQHHDAFLLNFADDSVIPDSVTPEAFLGVAQRFAKALGIVGGRDPRLYGVADRVLQRSQGLWQSVAPLPERPLALQSPGLQNHLRNSTRTRRGAGRRRGPSQQSIWLGRATPAREPARAAHAASLTSRPQSQARSGPPRRGPSGEFHPSTGSW